MTTPINGTGGGGAPPDANDQTVHQNDSPETEIRRFLERLFAPGDVFEVRAVNYRHGTGSFTSTARGYFTYEAIDAAVAEIVNLDASGRVPAVYVTLNPLSPALLARAANRLRSKAKETAADLDVVRRVWLLIDCDPVRASGISSTAGELEAARLTAERVRAALAAMGWPEPIMVMSGNGYHLLYRIDLPADDGGLIKRVLESLAAKFDDGAVKIDRSVHNPARITKIAGTMARKGDPLVGVAGQEDRPHRRARLVHAPDTIASVPLVLLEMLAAEAPQPAPPPPKGASNPRPVGSAGSKFDRFDPTPAGVRDYLEKHGIAVKGESRDTNGTWLYLDRCPVAADCVSTGDSDIGVFVGDNGLIGYKNQHDRGNDLHWRDVREALESGYKAFAESVGHTKGAASGANGAGVQLAVLGVDDKDRLMVVATAADGRELARDSVNKNSALSRKRLVGAITEAAGLDEEQAKEIDAAICALEPPPLATQVADLSPADALAARDEETLGRLEAMKPEVIAEALAMLADPRLIDRIVADIALIGVVGEEPLGLMAYVLGAGRLLPNPISAIVQGTSSSGKSYVFERVGRLMPEEAVLRATDMTANALYYLPIGSLMHTFVIGGERSRLEDDQRAEAKRALREMLSARELRKMLPVALPEGGFLTKVIFQPGPIAFVESTTNTQLFDEDANRCLLLSTDETPEQTARIMAAAAEAAKRGRPNTDAVVLRHHAMQRMLNRVEVRIPFADVLAAAMPNNRPEARRAFGQVLAVIQAVALLHQRQRKAAPVEHGDLIEASVADYVVARRLLSGPLGRSLGGSLPDAVARFGGRAKDRFGDAVFTSTQAHQREEIVTSKRKVNEYLRALTEAGVLQCVVEGKGSTPNSYRFIADIPQGGVAWLPTFDQVGGTRP